VVHVGIVRTLLYKHVVHVGIVRTLLYKPTL